MRCIEECIIPDAEQGDRERDDEPQANGVGACADRSQARQAQRL
jgi:hypothetical protein